MDRYVSPKLFSKLFRKEQGMCIEEVRPRDVGVRSIFSSSVPPIRERSYPRSIVAEEMNKLKSQIDLEIEREKDLIREKTRALKEVRDLLKRPKAPRDDTKPQLKKATDTEQSRLRHSHRVSPLLRTLRDSYDIITVGSTHDKPRGAEKTEFNSLLKLWGDDGDDGDGGYDCSL